MPQHIRMFLSLLLFIFSLDCTDKSNNFVLTPNTLQQLCFKVGAIELFNQHQQNHLDWRNYLQHKKPTYKERFETALAFSRKSKEKIKPFVWIDNFFFGHFLNTDINNKHFYQEKILITKIAALDWKWFTACLAIGVLGANFNWQTSIFMNIFLMRLYGIYHTKNCNSHILQISQTLNNNVYTTIPIHTETYHDKPSSKTHVYISKNYENDKQLCVLGDDFFVYINAKEKWFRKSYIRQTVIYNLCPDFDKKNIVFIGDRVNDESSNRDTMFFLLNLLQNKTLYIFAYTYRANGSQEYWELRVPSVQAYFTTQGRYIAVKKESYLYILSFDEFMNLRYIKGEIKNASFIDINESKKYILYWKKGILYKQFFNETEGFATEIQKADLYYDPQEIIGPSQLPFKTPKFTLLRAKRDQSLLVFNVSEEENAELSCNIAININKKVWFFLSDEEAKMAQNFRYDIEDLADIIQEKISHSDKQINLYKTKDRLLIVDRIKATFQKNNRALF